MVKKFPTVCLVRIQEQGLRVGVIVLNELRPIIVHVNRIHVQNDSTLCGVFWRVKRTETTGLNGLRKDLNVAKRHQIEYHNRVCVMVE